MDVNTYEFYLSKVFFFFSINLTEAINIENPLFIAI